VVARFDRRRATVTTKCACPKPQPLRFAYFMDFPRADCDRPMVLMAPCCGFSVVMRCNSHREDKCTPCALRYRRAVRRVAWYVPHNARFVYLLTLTAPGDRPHRMPGGILCDCTPLGGIDLADWNPRAGEQWHKLAKRLRLDDPDFQFFRAVEVQSRGALHLHVIVASQLPLSLPYVRRLAINYGFGHSVDLQVIDQQLHNVASYVAKYVSKAVTARGRVPWSKDVLDLDTGEIGTTTKPTFRAWSASRGWGVTMAQVRQALYVAYLRTLSVPPSNVALVVERPSDAPAGLGLPSP